jgi:GNAT superfamily N-acetyltransferase
MTWKIIATEIDKKGSNVVIKHSDYLAFTPSYAFFLKEVASLFQSGNALPYTYWNDVDCEILWAEIDNEIVGMISYDKYWLEKQMPHLSIVLTAVDQKFRQRGIHQIMNKHYENRAKELGCMAIRATVNLKNTVRIKSAEKDKLSPLMYIMSKRIR